MAFSDAIDFQANIFAAFDSTPYREHEEGTHTQGDRIGHLQEVPMVRLTTTTTTAS
jgi:hypothetical protein